MSYVFEPVEFQKHLNNSFVNTINAIHKEKFITEKQRVELLNNYSVMMESPHWLPKFVCKWIGLKEKEVVYRLVRAVGRCENEGSYTDEDDN